ncbi:HAD family phosphatase [Endozoicomonas sp. OPT23]|uniref:HAD family hydrolase n=1 Tax=Endozoicomonas sp. OPT23 TaxID=2072845 RepID=UPI001890C152|nr:HAD family phosphatase [Endozoicomonas sp. OPT23]
MLNDLQAIIFDMDGLIFDTEKYHRACWQEAGKSFGYGIDDTFLKQCASLTGQNTLRLLKDTFGEQCPAEALHLHKRKLFNQKIGLATIELKPGFAELFSWLRAQPVKLGLVTSSRQQTVHHNFVGMDALDAFNTIVTGEQVTNSKPDPEPYSRACRLLGVDPAKVMVFEDSNNGALSAIRAGCKAVMVPDFSSPVEEVAEKAHAIIDSLEQARGLIDL